MGILHLYLLYLACKELGLRVKTAVDFRVQQLGPLVSRAPTVDPPGAYSCLQPYSSTFQQIHFLLS